LESAVENGNTSEDIMKALNQLAGEGISKQSRTNGRLMNNYPDIRRRACLALGKIKTEQSKEYLVQVTLAENEPMVIAAAVNSLGEIGFNNNDEVVDAISFANRRNQILNPTSSLAFEVLDAYDGTATNLKAMVTDLKEIKKKARDAAENKYTKKKDDDDLIDAFEGQPRFNKLEIPQEENNEKESDKEKTDKEKKKKDKKEEKKAKKEEAKKEEKTDEKKEETKN
jgi:outer membrane biosynthesis protein TonB